jgi:hypothetical protein
VARAKQLWIAAAVLVAAAVVVVVIVVCSIPGGPEFGPLVGVWRNPKGYAGQPVEYQVGPRTIKVIRGMHVNHYRLIKIVKKGPRKLIVSAYAEELEREVTYTVDLKGPNEVVLHLSRQNIVLHRVR